MSKKIGYPNLDLAVDIQRMTGAQETGARGDGQKEIARTSRSKRKQSRRTKKKKA